MFNWLKNIFSRKKKRIKDYSLSRDIKEESPNSLDIEFGEFLKYYLYISKTKIEMLHPQIPLDFLKCATADVKLNFGIVSSTIKAGHVDSTVELLQKLAAVCEYLISKGKIGTIENPKSYIGATIPLKFGIVREYAVSFRQVCI